MLSSFGSDSADVNFEWADRPVGLEVVGQACSPLPVFNAHEYGTIEPIMESS